MMFKAVLIIHGHSADGVEAAYRAAVQAVREHPAATALVWRGWCETASAVMLAREIQRVDALWAAQSSGMRVAIDAVGQTR